MQWQSLIPPLQWSIDEVREEAYKKDPYVIAEAYGVSNRCAHVSASLSINFDII